MQKLLIICLLLALLGMPLVRAERTSRQNSLVLHHITVIDATGSLPQTDMLVEINEGRIVRIAKASETFTGGNLRFIDGTGKFLIPGLWDMHVHLLQEKRLKKAFPALLANGVLGIRDMGSRTEELEHLSEWRRQIESGELLGPRLIASGPMLDGATPMFAHLSLPAKDEAEARQDVDWLKQSGVDFIKVYSLLSRQAFFAIAEEAKKQGLAFAGHVPDSLSALEASNAGQRSIEHLSGILLACSAREDELRRTLIEARTQADPSLLYQALRLVQTQGAQTYSEEKAEALFSRFVKQGTWQVPTLVGVWNLPPASGLKSADHLPFHSASLDWRKGLYANRVCCLDDLAPDDLAFENAEIVAHIIQAMRRLGVEFMAGTDAPNLWAAPGQALHKELSLFVKAGFTPMEALQTATRNPAKYLGLLDWLGTVEEGKVADLVLLNANPLEDIANTENISAIIVQGKLISKAELVKLPYAARNDS